MRCAIFAKVTALLFKRRSAQQKSGHRARQLWLILACFSYGLCVSGATSAPAAINIQVGDSIRTVIEEMRKRGLLFAYSSSLLNDTQLVVAVPVSEDPVDIIREILAPHDLELHELDGVLIVAKRVSSTRRKSADKPGVKKLNADEQTVMDEIIVSASRYQMQRDAVGNSTSLDQLKLSQTPDLGNDPMRAVQRLPGATAEGASARSFIRGGTERETGIVLDGHRLLDPFHVRDYQSLFSAIDARAINDVEVYTGSFPVKYGNLTSGLVLIDSIIPEESVHTEFGVSVFNTSILSAGQISDGRAEWVFSARRGNLDLVLESKLGEPKYHDVFTKIKVNFTPETTVSANALIVNDIVKVITASDPEEREESRNDSRNTQFWLTWKQDWNSELSSHTLVSISDFQSEREASINDPEKIVGFIDDIRDVQITRVVQDWNYAPSDKHQVSWGGEFQTATTDYSYTSMADYFGFFQNLPGGTPVQARDIQRKITGDSISIYLADQWRINKKLIADIGFRWDKQNYTSLADNSQLSPRVGLLYRWSPQTSLRFSWGRYYQAQQIHELQVEDGVVQFYPSQRSDHAAIGIEREIYDRYAFRAELYAKSERQIRPRFENLFDPLTIIPELEPDRLLVVADAARSQGLELSIAYNKNENMNWWASYVLSRTEDRIDGMYTPRLWDQRHAVQLGMFLSGKRWSYSVAAHAHSGWPKSDVFLDPDSAPAAPAVIFGERNSSRFSGYFAVDMRLEYERPVRKGSLSWFVELSNATNQNNPCCVDYDLDPDNNGGFVLDKKEEYWFPRLPAAGVLWKF